MLATLLAAPVIKVLSGCVARNSSGFAGRFSPDAGERKLLEQVQSHLLPDSPGRPGATRMHSTDYLITVLRRADSEHEDSQAVVSGLTAIDGLSVDLFKRKFIELDSLQREQVLRAYEQTDQGYHWLSLILRVTLEGLLADPGYGSNVNREGWRWLSHNPGLPRPPRDKLYFEL